MGGQYPFTMPFIAFGRGSNYGMFFFRVNYLLRDARWWVVEGHPSLQEGLESHLLLFYAHPQKAAKNSIDRGSIQIRAHSKRCCFGPQCIVASTSADRLEAFRVLRVYISWRFRWLPGGVY